MIVFTILLLWLIYEVRSLVPILISAVVFAAAFEPGKRLIMRCRIPAPIAVVLLYLFVFFVFFFLISELVPIIIQQYSLFLGNLPTIIEYIKSITTGTPFQDFASLQGDRLVSATETLSETAREFVSAAGGALFSFFNGIINFFLFIVLTFLFTLNPNGIDNFFTTITPRNYRSYVASLLKRTRIKMGLWFKGQIIIILITGVLTYSSLLLLGVPNALFLASFAGTMELIPIFGPIIAAIPAILMALTLGDTTVVLLVILLFILIQQFQSNLIYPLIVSKAVGVPAVIVILSIFIGGSIAGVVGIIIAVPVAAIVQELFNDIRSNTIEKHLAKKQ